MSKRLTLKDLIDVKTRLGHHWEWQKDVFPKRRLSKSGDLQLHLTCGKCQSPHWVFWASIKNGRSSCCLLCSSVPSVEELKAISEKFKTKWTPSSLFRLKKLANGKTRRQNYMKCSCGHNSWVWLCLFGQGRSHSCIHCRNSKAKTKYDKYKHPLKRTWAEISRQDKLRQGGVAWKSWEDFRTWALDAGYLDGAKLKQRFVTDCCEIPEPLQPILGQNPMYKKDITKALLKYAREKKLMSQDKWNIGLRQRWKITPDAILAPFFGADPMMKVAFEKKIQKLFRAKTFPFSPENCYWDTSSVMIGRGTLRRSGSYSVVEL